MALWEVGKSAICRARGQASTLETQRQDFSLPSFLSLPSFFLSFLLFRPTPMASGGSQARDQVGSTAASLPHSHSNAASEPQLQPTSHLRQCWILNPLSKVRDQNLQPHGSSLDLFPLCHNGNSSPFFFF